MSVSLSFSLYLWLLCFSGRLFSLCATHPLTQAACLLEGASVDSTCAPKDKQGLFSPLTPFSPFLMYVLYSSFFCPIPWCTCIMYVHTCIHTHTSIWPHATNGYSFVVGPSPSAVTPLCKSLSQGLFFSQAPKGTLCA